jgi:hypothetical protein
MMLVTAAVVVVASLSLGAATASAANSPNCSWLSYTTLTSYGSGENIGITTFDHGGWSGFPSWVTINGKTFAYQSATRYPTYYFSRWVVTGTPLARGTYSGTANTNGTNCSLPGFTVQ